MTGPNFASQTTYKSSNTPLLFDIEQSEIILSC